MIGHFSHFFFFSKLLCLIGDAFGEESDQICGAVINIRRGVDKIAVWTSDYKDEAAVMKRQTKPDW